MLLSPHAMTAGDLQVNLNVNTTRPPAMSRQRAQTGHVLYDRPGTSHLLNNTILRTVRLGEVYQVWNDWYLVAECVLGHCKYGEPSQKQYDTHSDVLLHLCCILRLPGNPSTLSRNRGFLAGYGHPAHVNQTYKNEGTIGALFLGNVKNSNIQPKSCSHSF